MIKENFVINFCFEKKNGWTVTIRKYQMFIL